MPDTVNFFFAWRLPFDVTPLKQLAPVSKAVIPEEKAKRVEMADRQRLDPPKQTLDDAYAAPANFLEVDVVSPETHGVGKKRYTDYEVRMRVGILYNNFGI